MCYYGSEYPRFIKKDQGHFNLMADLHTLVRNGQQNMFLGDEGKKKLVKQLLSVIENVEKGEYNSTSPAPSTCHLEGVESSRQHSPLPL